MSGRLTSEDEYEIDMRIRLGQQLLVPGALYTAGRIAFTVVKHAPHRRPRLKLKLYPAHFVHSMSRMMDRGEVLG